MKANQVFLRRGGLIGVFVLSVLFMGTNSCIPPSPDGGLHPATNYGPENTWFHLVYFNKINYRGSHRIFVLSGNPQNECRNVKGISTVRDGRSVKLRDHHNPNSPLPEGMKVIIYWGKKCPDWKPYGVITVPANTNEIRVPRLNKPSANYQVFNNFNQRDGGERKLNGHTYGVVWSVPQ